MAVVERALCPVLVGREDEVTLLEDALLASCRGDGQVVVLAGDAGVGKTRLATETVDRARKVGAAVLSGGCSEADLALPYLPFVEAIGNWLGKANISEIVAALGPFATELAQLFPQLGSAQSSAGNDPSQSKLRLYEAVLALLRVTAADKGLLFVIEDLHWADAATRELLDYMTRRMRGSRIMVLATYRQDEMHRKHPLVPIVQGWRRSRLAQVIELSPLPAAGVAAMIAAIFDYDEVSHEFRDLFLERTEGNPFVIEEMLKEAIDRGDIYRTDTRWERKGLEDLTIPRSVADSILWRVERLDPDHAEVLRYASVLGPSFSYSTLVAATEMAEPVVRDALQAAILQQLVVEEGSGRYRFRHALTREAIYEDMIRPRREEIHSRIAEILKMEPETPAVDLARHLLAAQRWTEAVPVCLAAAQSAMERRAFTEAAEIAGRSLEHVDGERARGGVLGLIGEAYFGAGDASAAKQHLSRAVEILERDDETLECARLMLILGRCEWMTRNHERAAEHYEKARRLLEPSGPTKELATAYIRLAGLDFFNFRYSEAEANARKAIEIAREAGDEHTRVWAAGFLGGALVEQDFAEEGLRWMDEALDEAIRIGDADVAGNTIHNTIVMRIEAGLLDAAEATIRRFPKLPPHPWNDFSEAFNSGSIAMIRGRMPEALSLFARAQSAVEFQDAVWHDWIINWSNVATAASGRVDDVQEILGREFPRGEAQDIELQLLGRLHVALAGGRTEDAERIAKWTLDADVRDASIVMLAGLAFVASGKIDAVRELIARSSKQSTERGRLFIAAAEGLLAHAEGRDEEASRLLNDVTDRFAAEGSMLFEWYLLPALAEAQVATGDVEAARAVLERMISTATVGGARAFEEQGRACAANLGIDVKAAEPQPPTPVPPDLVETSERIVTVMFADVRGYTAMTRETAPAEMHERMTTFYRWARSEIERHDGMVDRYAGDAVMASWNSAVSSLDHTTLAVETAVILQDKAALMDLPVGVGIAVGAALVGRMTGSDNVDVIGDTTNLAARLQAQAAPREVLLSPDAFRRAKQWIDEHGYAFEERVLSLKGYDEPITANVIKRG